MIVCDVYLYLNYNAVEINQPKRVKYNKKGKKTNQQIIQIMR